MSANDGPANPTEPAELTPEQLQMRLAQAQAEAEAARLQVEVLKLQAQLADSKGGTSDPAGAAPPTSEAPASVPEQKGARSSAPAAKKQKVTAVHPTSRPAKAKPSALDGEKAKRSTAARHKDEAPKKQPATSRGPVGAAKSPPPLPAGKEGDVHVSKEKDNPKTTQKTVASTAAVGSVVATADVSARSSRDEPATKRPETSSEAAVKEKPTSVAPPALGTVAVAPAAVLTVPVTPPVEQSPAIQPPTPPPGEEIQAEPTDGAAEESEYEEEEDRRGWATLMLAAPSWLVSLLFHLAVILAAALLGFTVNEGAPRQILIAKAAEEEEEVLEEVVIEKQEDLEDIEMKSIPTPSMDPGAIDFGEMAGADLPASNVSIGLDTTDPQMVEIGALFGTGGQGMAAHGDGMSGTFFNVKATGSRFAFVVDSSMSMKAGKFEAACEELFYAASRLTEEQAFYVVFFDWDAARMFDQENPEPRMVRATPQNLQRLKYWMEGVELELKTNPYDSMEFAMKLMPDAIYVLSDGVFTDKGRTVNWLKKVNLVDDDLDGIKPIVTIHTIGFYTEDNGTLKQMAETYGGTYRFVPKPPNFKKGGGPRRKRP
jgi:hypothetical protein